MERKRKRAGDHIQRKTANLHSRGGRNALLEKKNNLKAVNVYAEGDNRLQF